MCMFSTPDYPEPEMPTERQAQRLPDGQTVQSNTARRMTDRMRAGANTVLTSGSGVTESAATGGKTLLGA